MKIYELELDCILSCDCVNTITQLTSDITVYLSDNQDESRNYIIDVATDSSNHKLTILGSTKFPETIQLLAENGMKIPTLEKDSRYIFQLTEMTQSQFLLSFRKVQII